MISTCRTQTMGWGLCPSPRRVGSAPRSRGLPFIAEHHSTDTRTVRRTTKVAVSTHTFLGVWPRPPYGDGLPLCRELRDPKAVGADGSGIHSNSHGIHTVLATRPPRTEPRASKELHKGNTKIICMQGRGYPPSRPFTQAECALGLEPKRLSASTTTFLEPQGNNNKLSQSEQKGGASSPPLRLTLCQLPNNLPGCLISLELWIPQVQNS